MFVEIQYHPLESVESTSEYAKSKDKLPKHNVLLSIYAREQTQGKGRFGKRWIAKKDSSILLTFVFKTKPLPLPHQLTQVLAYSVIDWLKNFSMMAEAKWPNDIFVHGKKMGGILLETYEDHFILGIGLNLNQTQAELNEIDQKATSFFVETGRNLYMPEAVKVLSQIFQSHLNHYLDKGFEFFYHHLKSCLYGLYKSATWTDDKHTKTGVIQGINPEGYLMLNVDGSIQTIRSGSLVVTQD
jgi:BirA family biotin operon repressor/biotin-[acetyl-CoA-carboxylase] ligase